LIKREVGAQGKLLISLDADSRSLDARELELDGEPTIEEALCRWKDSAADFADCLIGAHHR
jgi:hypothetical protein